MDMKELLHKDKEEKRRAKSGDKADEKTLTETETADTERHISF